MSGNQLDQYIAARLLQADLITLQMHFLDAGISDMAGVASLKNALLALTNLVDFERTIRSIYQNNKALSASFHKHSKNYEFAKYLRNKFVGHIHSELIEKAIEWKPELRYLAINMDDQKIMAEVNIYILETAINTYVGVNGKHKIFNSETDLLYPPDWKRFMNYLEVSIRSAIDYLNELCLILSACLAHHKADRYDAELWLKAGHTEFRFLKK